MKTKRIVPMTLSGRDFSEKEIRLVSVSLRIIEA